MKVEVRCSDCANAWLVDERSLGGELLCPSCLTRIRLVPGAEPSAQDRKPVDRTASASRKERAARPNRAVEPASNGASTAEQVVCPRCKLHFFPRPQAEESEDARPTVLVVEDLEYFRQIAADALAPKCEVRTAAGSAEARALLAEGGIDLIVLDLTLDGGDQGLALLRELNPKPCPILIYTAQDESEMYGDSWEELVDLGADDLVIKGMNAGESLLRKVSTLLGMPLEENAAG